jgi:tetratricopeptide (TPR) repeat protein
MKDIIERTTVRGLRLSLAAAAVLVGSNLSAQTTDGLRYNATYRCGGESVEVGHCRHDSDTPGYPATTPQDDYCSVYYPDRPKRGGFTFETVELRGEVIEKLQACGALPSSRPKNAKPSAPAENGAEAFVLQADKDYRAKEYGKALEDYQKVVALKPDSGTLQLAYSRMGWIYNDSNKYDKAVLCLRDAVRLKPQDSLAQYELGFALFSLKEYAQAMEAYEKLVALRPESVILQQAYYRMGWINNNSKEYDKAVPYLRDAVRLKPQDSLAQYELGFALFSLKKYPQAASAFQQAIRLKPDDSSYHFWLGETYIVGLSQTENAVSAFRESLRLKPNDARTFGELGMAYYNLKQYPNAAAAFREGIRLQPDLAVFYLMLGRTYAATGKKDQAHQVSAALAKLDKSLADTLNTDIINNDPSNRASAALALAKKSFEAKDYVNAIKAYTKVISLRPDSETLEFANYQIGWARNELKQYDQAIPFLREAARRGASRDGQATYELGVAHYGLGQYREALAAFQQTVRLRPDYAKAQHWIGSTQLALGHKEEALKIYQALQEVNPDEATGLYLEITKAGLNEAPAKAPVAQRAKAYLNLDLPTLLDKATLGDDAAMKRLSDLYYEKHDKANGLKWRIKAAEQGDPDLQNEIGWYYEISSPKDINEARRWYRKAGEQGWDAAELNLCNSYATELGLDQDVVTGPGKDDPQSPIKPVQGNKGPIEESFRWCGKAANQGLYLAAWNLGVLHAKGNQYRAPDYAQAYFWLSNGGLQSGTVFREKVGRRLTAAQRTEIEKRAANFHPPAMKVLHDELAKNPAQPR